MTDPNRNQTQYPKLAALAAAFILALQGCVAYTTSAPPPRPAGHAQAVPHDRARPELAPHDGSTQGVSEPPRSQGAKHGVKPEPVPESAPVTVPKGSARASAGTVRPAPSGQAGTAGAAGPSRPAAGTRPAKAGPGKPAQAARAPAKPGAVTQPRGQPKAQPRGQPKAQPKAQPKRPAPDGKQPPLQQQ